MAEEQTPADRLRETWVELGLAPDAGLSQMQLEAFEAYRKWWAGAVKDGVRKLRAVQILMLPADREGVHRRPEFMALARLLASAWSNIGTAGEHVRFVQAMVVAAWTEGSASRRRIASILRPITLRATVETRSTLARAVWTAPRRKADTTVQTKLKALGDATSVAHVRDRAREAIEAQGARITASGRSKTLDMLWWGQARYSHYHEAPYRTLDVANQMYWTIRDSRYDSYRLRPAAVASYIAEVWHALGLQLTDEKPLSGWLEEIISAFPEDFEPEWAELLKGGATGLPVSWLSVQSDPQAALAEVADATLVDLGLVLTRQEWAAWLVAESFVETHLV